MKTLPSKELISKVLKVKVSDSKDFCLCLENSNIEYGKVEKYGTNRENINIYELAHKCKKWAFKQGYELFSRILSNDNQRRGNCLVIRVESDPETVLTISNAETEPEAIFKATSYIMEQLKQKD